MGGCMETQEQRAGPLRDYSLFGNDSDDSDLDELEAVVKGIPESAQVSASGKSKALCALSGEELYCEASGEAEIVCVRLGEGLEPKIVASIVQDSREKSKKVQVQENDLLVVIVGKACTEGIIELIKKTTKEKATRSGLAKRVAEELGECLEGVEKSARMTIIAAKISREI
eukprot:TRINITY_DN3197_c0_g2_i1.p1 TRINITY_DN3197_c0_g2~~TRINITY_DN3197_c0_g2_i1.p1  ORF type:complete len:171 (-),score=55.94 TRINITY_DN3197_c0_g2_i1:176-688(-)